MLRFASLRALGASMAACAALALAAPASATAYTFDFTNQGSGTGSYGVFSATGSDGSVLSVKITGLHANDTTTAVSTDAVSSATLGIWQGYGLGVIYGSDKASNGTHQIDNVGGGADLVTLQFSSDVSISSLTRNVYSMSGVSCCDSDASYWADTSNVYGSPSSSSTLSVSKVDESVFTTLAGGSTSSTASLVGSASVWMIGAAFNQSNDGFKIAGFTVNTASVAAVPEPASWAMMIGGFGMVGAGMRRRRQVLATA